MAKLSLRCQYLGKEMDAYMNRFHEKALYCCNPVAEDLVVEVCVHGMIEDCRIYLENLSFSYFSRLRLRGK